MSPTSQCPLAYPDRYHAAVNFWRLQPAGTKALSQENQLLLYALNQQATVGPNTTPKPWGWNVVETTKWHGWKELGKMSTIEAMRLFVKVFEEEQPDWWSLLQQAEAAPKATGEAPCPTTPMDDLSADGDVAAAAEAARPRSVADRALLGLWTQLEAASAGGESVKKPVPRYESAAAVVGDHVYLLGGNYGGRYLSDAWSLDLATGAWSPVQLQGAAVTEAAVSEADIANPAAAGASFPPTAGHSATAWSGKVYVLGGHTKAKAAGAMCLRVVDPSTQNWSEPETSGQAPTARGGHTATLLGSKLWVIGGEDSARRALADVHVLDLENLTWSTPEVGGKAPPGRSASCAIGLEDRYILLFGGGSVATCFNDLHLLDTQTMAWSQPAQAGAKVTPRAGHSGAVLGDIWYIVGGGNNVKGCTDLLAADLSGLAESGTVTWHVVTSVGLRDPLSSEGISLVVLPEERVMLAFGGYNGKYQNTVSLFRAPVGAAALLAGSAAAAATAVEAQKAKLANGTAAKAEASEAGATTDAEAAPQVAQPAPEVSSEAAAPPKAGDANKTVLSPQTSSGGRDGGAGTAAAMAVSELSKQVAELRGQLETARHEAENAIRESAAAKEGAAHELSLLRKQLVTAQAALTEANKALEETRAALAAEQSKVLKLEAQSAELQAKLAQLGELERELEKLRRAAKEAADKEAAAKKGGGLWGYIAGGGNS